MTRRDPLIISVNFVPHQYRYDLLFLTNDRRYEETREEIDWNKTIATSNIPGAARGGPDGELFLPAEHLSLCPPTAPAPCF